jgi:hypothetical protein
MNFDDPKAHWWFLVFTQNGHVVSSCVVQPTDVSVAMAKAKLAEIHVERGFHGRPEDRPHYPFLLASMAAIQEAHRREINPGEELRFGPIDANQLPAEGWRNRLLSKDETEALMERPMFAN